MKLPKRVLAPLLLLSLLLAGTAVSAAPTSRRPDRSPVRVRTKARPQPRQATITVKCPICESEGWKAKILAEKVPIDTRGVSHGLAFNMFAEHQDTRLKPGGVSHAEFVALYRCYRSGSWEIVNPRDWVGTNVWYTWFGERKTYPTRNDGLYYQVDDKVKLAMRRLRTEFGTRYYRTTCNNPMWGKETPPPVVKTPPTRRIVKIAVQKVRHCDHGCPEGAHPESFHFSLKLKDGAFCASIDAANANQFVFSYAVNVSSDDTSEQIFQICEELTDAQKAAGWGYLSAKTTSGVTEVRVSYSSPALVVVQVTNIYRHRVVPPGPTKRVVKVGIQKSRFCNQSCPDGSHPEPFHVCLKQNGKACAALDCTGDNPLFFDYSVTVTSDMTSDIVFEVCEELTDVQVAAGWEYLSARATKGVVQIRINYASPDEVVVQITNLFRHRVVPPPPAPPLVLIRPQLPPIPKEGFVDSNGFRRYDEIRGPSFGFIPRLTTCNECGRPQNRCPGHPGKHLPPGPIPKGGGKTPRDPITGKPPVDRVPKDF